MNPKLVAISFLAVSVCLSIPILFHPYLPLVDLPNHIARLYIAANLGTALDAYYDYNLKFGTNIAADLIWALGGKHIWNPTEFANLTLAFYAVSFLASCMVLARVVMGKWSIWPLIVNLVVFNAAYFWGFQNFLLTVPFSVFAFAAWLALEGKPVSTRILIFTPICLLLYVMHIFGLVVFLALAVGREVQRVIMAGRGWLTVFKNNFALAIPFLVPISIALYEWRYGPENLFGGQTRFGTVHERILALTSPVHSVTADASPWFNATGYVVLVFLAAIMLTTRKTSGARLILHTKMVGPLLALLVLVLAMPAILNGVAYANIRFPFILVAVFLVSTRWTDLQFRHAVALFVMVAALGITRVIMLERFTAQNSRGMNQLVAVLEHAPAGSRILPIHDMSDGPAHRLLHVQAYAVSVSNAFVPTVFLGAHALSLKQMWWDRAISQGHSVPWQFLNMQIEVVDNPNPLITLGYLTGWQDKFTHVVQLNALPADALADLPLALIVREGSFALYAIAD